MNVTPRPASAFLLETFLSNNDNSNNNFTDLNNESNNDDNDISREIIKKFRTRFFSLPFAAAVWLRWFLD